MVEIIAEIAQGYEGKPMLAELLVRGALAAGADAVKLQLVFADELCVPAYPYYSLFQSLEMDDAVWSALVTTVHNSGKNLYFDVYGDRSLDLALRLGADGVKISTTDFYNVPLIDRTFSEFERVYISTGGVPSDDIEALMARAVLPSTLTLLHGFQAEPTAIQDNNLARIATLGRRFSGAGIGFMDHTAGDSDDALYVPLIALGLGVTCIEKHITLDYALQIEDYVSALSVDRFRAFVQLVRKLESALGSRELVPTPKEIEYKNRAGKLAVARRDLPKGTRLRETDIVMKRVSTTHSDKHFRQVAPVVGRTLLMSLEKDQPFDKAMLS